MASQPQLQGSFQMASDHSLYPHISTQRSEEASQTPTPSHSTFTDNDNLSTRKVDDVFRHLRHDVLSTSSNQLQESKDLVLNNKTVQTVGHEDDDDYSPSNSMQELGGLNIETSATPTNGSTVGYLDHFVETSSETERLNGFELNTSTTHKIGNSLGYIIDDAFQTSSEMQSLNLHNPNTTTINPNNTTINPNTTTINPNTASITTDFAQHSVHTHTLQSPPETDSLTNISTIFASNSSLHLDRDFSENMTTFNSSLPRLFQMGNGSHITSSFSSGNYSEVGTISWVEYDIFPLSSSGYNVDIGNRGDQRPFDSSQELIFKVSILVLISICGSVGNFLVIGSIIKTRHLHRPPFYFLLSMAATDLSRAGFCVPVVMATTLQGSRWGHGAAACKLFAFATCFFVFSSTLSLLTISIDRHASIVYSKAYRRRCHGLANLVVVVFIWAIAFCISFPPVFGAGDYVFIKEEAQCAFKHRNYAHSDGVAFVMLFLAIVILTYFLYFRIYRFMRSHRRMRPLQHQPARSSTWTFVGPGANGQAFINWLNGFGGQAPNRQSGQRTVQRLNFGRVVNLSSAKNEHLTRLFLTLTLVFGVTWAPYVIVCLCRIFLDHAVLPSGFVTSAAWTSYSQVALSPLTYFLVRGKVKRTSRTIQACSGDRKEFLLENKTQK